MSNKYRARRWREKRTPKKVRPWNKPLIMPWLVQPLFTTGFIPANASPELIAKAIEVAARQEEVREKQAQEVGQWIRYVLGRDRVIPTSQIRWWMDLAKNRSSPCLFIGRRLHSAAWLAHVQRQHDVLLYGEQAVARAQELATKSALSYRECLRLGNDEVEIQKRSSQRMLCTGRTFDIVVFDEGVWPNGYSSPD